MHYFYVAAPIGFQPSDCNAYKTYLESECQKQLNQHSAVIYSVQMTMRENILRYQGNQKSPYLKITVVDPKMINRVRTMVSKGNANWKRLWPAREDGILTFDNIAYVLRFMIDTKIAGMSWVEIPAGKYKLLNPRDQHSNCQIEAQVHYSDLIAHSSEGEYSKMAPLRILSFDIECAGRKGIFPEANVDPVIQIANVVTRYGDPKPFVRNVFCMDTVSPIVATQILSFSNEGDMLMKWRDFLEEVDPDVIIGYNTSNFDFPYLLDRAKHLKLPKFPYWSRLKTVQSKVRTCTSSISHYVL
jgi:DNA polymerase delta subunit 1